MRNCEWEWMCMQHLRYDFTKLTMQPWQNHILRDIDLTCWVEFMSPPSDFSVYQIVLTKNWTKNNGWYFSIWRSLVCLQWTALRKFRYEIHDNEWHYCSHILHISLFRYTKLELEMCAKLRLLNSTKKIYDNLNL